MRLGFSLWPLSVSLFVFVFVAEFCSRFVPQVVGTEQHPVQVLAKLKEIV